LARTWGISCFADSLYLGVLDGTLDKRLWRGYERTLADTVAYPGFQTWWATRKHWHADEFYALIDRHIQTAKPKVYVATPKCNGSASRTGNAGADHDLLRLRQLVAALRFNYLLALDLAHETDAAWEYVSA
jgi:hypothetical protein